MFRKVLMRRKKEFKFCNNARERKIIMSKIREWRRKEELMWWQRFRVDFLKYGDFNLRWFYEKVNMLGNIIILKNLWMRMG